MVKMSAVKQLFRENNEEMQIEMVKEAFDAIMEGAANSEIIKQLRQKVQDLERELGLVNHRLDLMQEFLHQHNIVGRSANHFSGESHDCDTTHGVHRGSMLTPGMGFTDDRVRGKSVGGGEQLSPHVTGSSAEGGDTFTAESQHNNEGPSTVRVVESAAPITEIGPTQVNYSNVCTRIKDKPGIRTKSTARRTPYTSNLRPKKK